MERHHPDGLPFILREEEVIGIGEPEIARPRRDEVLHGRVPRYLTHAPVAPIAVPAPERVHAHQVREDTVVREGRTE